MRKLKSLLFLVLLLLPGLALAQVSGPTVPTDAVPDYTAFGVLLIATIGGFAVTVATWLFKKLVPSIPAVAWPIVVVGLGQLVAVVQAYATHSFANPLVGAAVSAGASVIYGIYTTAQSQGLKKSVQVVTILLLGGIGLSACASVQTAKHPVVVGVSGVGTALDLVTVNAINLRCGKPTAPIAPLCVTNESFAKIKPILKEALATHVELTDVVLAIPDDTPTTAQAMTLAAKLWALIDRVLALIPSSKPQASLSSNVAKLKAQE